MILTHPYHIEIHSQQEAIHTIKNMCNFCPKRLNCTGNDAMKCNQVKEKITKTWKGASTYEK